MKTPRGWIDVSSPEATAFDLVGYPKHTGGLDNVATVLAELRETIDGEQLAAVAHLSPTPWAQRLGHLLDLTGCLLRTANRGVPPCLSQIVLLDVARLRLRRPIRDKPSGYLRFAALATKPGEKCGLVNRSSGANAPFRNSSDELLPCRRGEDERRDGRRNG